MKVRELIESTMPDRYLELHASLMQKFGLGNHDAEDVLDFALGNKDWEALGEEPREKLYSYYQKTMPYGISKAKTGNPYVFIFDALRNDFGIR